MRLNVHEWMQQLTGEAHILNVKPEFYILVAIFTQLHDINVRLNTQTKETPNDPRADIKSTLTDNRPSGDGILDSAN